MGFLDFLFRRKKPAPPPFAASSPDRTMFGIPGQAAAVPSADPASSPDRTMFGIPGQAAAPAPVAPAAGAGPDLTMFGVAASVPPVGAPVPPVAAPVQPIAASVPQVAAPVPPVAAPLLPVAAPAPPPVMAAAAPASTPVAAVAQAPAPAAPPAPAETSAPTVVVRAAPQPRARLRLETGGSGPWDLVDREYTVGRSSGSDIILSDATVSGRHAQLVLQGDGFAIRDLGSTNGTKVDGVPVTADRPLRGGETILLGECALLYERP